MADNVYLLETRLSRPQQAALSAVRGVARQRGLTVFLVGGAVRDLISGSPVRDLDVAVQGNALDLRAELEQAGGSLSGQSDELQALYLRFPGGVRVEVGSTLSVAYPKPSQPVFQPTSILEDLRRRDFTANAMALSLNDGSYGLLMDPLNGVADIENRELRLVSNYGFIEDPVRLIRGARFMARLGWQMDERTRARYETARDEAYIDTLRPADRGYELEELFHEEDPLRVMRRLEEEGWLRHLSPALGVAKANVAELSRLRDVQMQFQTRGVVADIAAANFALLTSKLSPAEIGEIRGAFPRAGFVEEIGALDSAAKDLSARLLSKELAAASLAYQFLMEAPAATVVYAAYSSRSTALQNRLKSFLTEWPNAQGKIPYVLMQEMRITPDLPEYAEVVQKAMFAIMDGKLGTAEETRAFLEPFSPPAPPPPVSLRRPRAPRKEAKGKGKKKTVSVAAEENEDPFDVASVEVEQEDAPAAAASSPVEVSPEAGSNEPEESRKPVRKSIAPEPASLQKASSPTVGRTPSSAKAETVSQSAKPTGKPPAKEGAKPPTAKGKLVSQTPAKDRAATDKTRADKGKTADSPARTASKAVAAVTSKKAATGKQTQQEKTGAPAKKAASKPTAASAARDVKKSAPRPAPAKKSVIAKPARRAAKPTPPAKRTPPAKVPARAAKSAPAKGRR